MHRSQRTRNNNANTPTSNNTNKSSSLPKHKKKRIKRNNNVQYEIRRNFALKRVESKNDQANNQSRIHIVSSQNHSYNDTSLNDVLYKQGYNNRYISPTEHQNLKNRSKKENINLSQGFSFALEPPDNISKPIYLSPRTADRTLELPSEYYQYSPLKQQVEQKSTLLDKNQTIDHTVDDKHQNITNTKKINRNNNDNIYTNSTLFNTKTHPKNTKKNQNGAKRHYSLDNDHDNGHDNDLPTIEQIIAYNSPSAFASFSASSPSLRVPKLTYQKSVLRSHLMANGGIEYNPKLLSTSSPLELFQSIDDPIDSDDYDDGHDGNNNTNQRFKKGQTILTKPTERMISNPNIFSSQSYKNSTTSTPDGKLAKLVPSKVTATLDVIAREELEAQIIHQAKVQQSLRDQTALEQLNNINTGGDRNLGIKMFNNYIAQLKRMNLTLQLSYFLNNILFDGVNDFLRFVYIQARKDSQDEHNFERFEYRLRNPEDETDNVLDFNNRAIIDYQLEEYTIFYLIHTYSHCTNKDEFPPGIEYVLDTIKPKRLLQLSARFIHQFDIGVDVEMLPSMPPPYDYQYQGRVLHFDPAIVIMNIVRTIKGEPLLPLDDSYKNYLATKVKTNTNIKMDVEHVLENIQKGKFYQDLFQNNSNDDADTMKASQEIPSSQSKNKAQDETGIVDKYDRHLTQLEESIAGFKQKYLAKSMADAQKESQVIHKMDPKLINLPDDDYHRQTNIRFGKLHQLDNPTHQIGGLNRSDEPITLSTLGLFGKGYEIDEEAYNAYMQEREEVVLQNANKKKRPSSGTTTRSANNNDMNYSYNNNMTSNLNSFNNYMSKRSFHSIPPSQQHKPNNINKRLFSSKPYKIDPTDDETPTITSSRHHRNQPDQQPHHHHQLVNNKNNHTITKNDVKWVVDLIHTIDNDDRGDTNTIYDDSMYDDSDKDPELYVARHFNHIVHPIPLDTDDNDMATMPEEMLTSSYSPKTNLYQHHHTRLYHGEKHQQQYSRPKTIAINTREEIPHNSKTMIRIYGPPPMIYTGDVDSQIDNIAPKSSSVVLPTSTPSVTSTPAAMVSTPTAMVSTPENTMVAMPTEPTIPTSNNAAPALVGDVTDGDVGIKH